VPMLSARSAGSMRMPARFLMTERSATGWEAWLASARQVEHQGPGSRRSVGQRPCPDRCTSRVKRRLSLRPITLGRYSNGRMPTRSAPTTASGTLYLAQPVRHDNGVWVVTRVGDPVS
jgi:hypothetical protein